MTFELTFVKGEFTLNCFHNERRAGPTVLLVASIVVLTLLTPVAVLTQL